MSKFPRPILPSVAGALTALGAMYMVADQLLADLKAPARSLLSPSAAMAQTTASPPAPSPALDTALPARFGLGREAVPEEIAAWDIDVRPDGLGLPNGSGSVLDGEDLYIDNCAVCHGDFGEAVGRWPVLAGGQGSLTEDDPNKTIGSFWPYLSTVYDYVYRAMPFGAAQSLAPDEVYAITAYLLYLNDLVDDDFVLSKENFLEVRLPNEPNFFDDDRMEVEFPKFVHEPCMENCKDSVEITARAMVLDVTPDDGAEAGAAAPTEAAQPAVETAAAEPAEDASVAQPESEPAAAAAGPDPVLVAAGEAAFKKCSACHQVGEDARNRVGPQLNGVIGRPAGRIEGFRYSNPLAAKAEEGLVWTDEAMAAFLANPRDYLPGTKMAFAGLRDEGEVAAVIAYLKTFAD
jgi:cytochrome c